jgi:hypothetical protein
MTKIQNSVAVGWIKRSGSTKIYHNPVWKVDPLRLIHPTATATHRTGSKILPVYNFGHSDFVLRISYF